MSVFYVKKERKNILKFLPAFLFLLAVVGLFLFSGSVTKAGDSHEKEIVSSALDRSITECYALEGFYPPDLKYLSDHYGFTYNGKHFFIDYQYIGSNIRPDVTIIELEAEK